MFSPLQGFANALVYGLNRQVIRAYRTKCCLRQRNSAVEMMHAPSLTADDDDELAGFDEQQPSQDGALSSSNTAESLQDESISPKNLLART